MFDGMSLARFAFGNSIGAIESLMGEGELQIIKENDLKSSKMSLVCTVTAFFEDNADMSFFQHTNFPSIMRMYDMVGEAYSRVTGWGGSSKSSKEFEDVCTSQSLKYSLCSKY